MGGGGRAPPSGLCNGQCPKRQLAVHSLLTPPQILTMDEVSTIGKISKQWTGLLREIFTDTDNFGIQFPMDLDVKMKATMIGACFLIVSGNAFVFRIQPGIQSHCVEYNYNNNQMCLGLLYGIPHADADVSEATFAGQNLYFSLTFFCSFSQDFMFFETNNV